MFRVREPTSKVFGFRQSFEKVKLAKRTVLYTALNPKNLNVEQLRLNTNCNALGILSIRAWGQGAYIQVIWVWAVMK